MSKINPKTINSIFDDSVLEALPSNDKIKHGIAIAKRNADPVYNQKRNAALQAVMATEEWKKANKQAIKKWKNDPQWQQEQQERIERRATNPEWNKNVRAAIKDKKKPCITPLGVFSGVNEAGDYYDDQRGTKCGRTVVCRNLKKESAGYRYISVEEYTMLTGKDI